MLFSSIIFLCIFFPVVFVVSRLLGKKLQNIFLLVASLLFYAWGEPLYILLLISSIAINYFYGLIIDKSEKISTRKIWLTICIVTNILILGYFKYFNFFSESINTIFSSNIIQVRQIVLPLGISFYTFQILSYVIDVYRKDAKVQKNPIDLALYVSFFPELISGPIIKYRDINSQIKDRKINSSKTAYGIKRFIYGLGKKIIISNTLAACVDDILKNPVNELGTSLAWIVVIMYTLQIYFDFSGYSDMAIGLGRMFGFDFMENFNYPYISRSIQEFWRRWHISLSTWFREYLYIPLGGNRKGKIRTYVNLFIVFLTTGLWHGASLNFIFWGLFHGFFIIIERMFLGKLLKNNRFKFINHIYTMMVVMIGWLFFRVENILDAFRMLKVMFIPTKGSYMIGQFVNNKAIFCLILAVLLCGIVQSVFKKMMEVLYNEERVYVLESIYQFGILFVSMMLLVTNTYNPFVYFKF